MGFFIFTFVQISLFIMNSCIRFTKKNEKYLAAGLMFLFMFLFAALRGSGDADYYNYLWFCGDIGTDFSKVLNFSYPVEFSFRLFSYLINSLSLSKQRIIVIMNFLSLLPTAYFICKESENPFLSAIIFLPIFLQFDMQTSRTATAIGLGLMSIYFNMKERYLPTFVFFLFSLSFHRSAVILLPFLLLMHLEIGNKFKIFTLGLAFFISLFSKKVMLILAKVMSIIGLSRMQNKIISYTFEGKFASFMSFFDPRIIFALLLFLTSLMYFRDRKEKKLSIEDTAIKSVYFTLIILLLFRSSTAIAFRFSTFFSIMQTIYIPLVIKEIRKIDPLGSFLIKLSILVFIIPYSIFLMVKAPSYDFFFTNLQAIQYLK
jgi:hypothetical protein